jgi:hypothetical protein
MYSYKKSYAVLILSFLILTTPAAHAIPKDMELVVVPTATGLLSGCIYGMIWNQGSILGLILSNLLIGRCKDRIFKNFDKNYQVKAAGTGLSVTCEAVPSANQKATYIINIGEEYNDKTTKYSAMSDFDDLVTMATMLAMILGGK